MRHTMKQLAVGAVLLVVLGACSGGDDGGSAGVQASFGGTFCDAVKEYASLAKSGAVGVNIDSSMSDEEVDRRVAEAEQRLKTQLAKGRVILADVEERAPAEIRADVALVVKTELEYYDALEENDYDAWSLITDPRFGPRGPLVEAAKRVNAYTEEKCGTPLKPDIDEIGTVTSTVETPGPIGTPGTVPMPPPPPPPPPVPPSG